MCEIVFVDPQCLVCVCVCVCVRLPHCLSTLILQSVPEEKRDYYKALIEESRENNKLVAEALKEAAQP